MAMTGAKQVGIWIRVSTNFQAESDSPEHHEIRARGYATSREWQVAEIYRLVYTCKACKNRIAAADLDEIYYLQLESFLTSMSVSDYEQQSGTDLEEKEGLLKAAQGEAQKLRKRVHDLVNLRLDGELDKERFAELHLPLNERLEQLDRYIPELEAEIDFRNIQRLSSATVLQEAKDLYAQWPTFSFEQKRGIVEIITEQIIVDKDEITMTFIYLPPQKTAAAPSSLNSGKRVPAL